MGSINEKKTRCRKSRSAVLKAYQKYILGLTHTES